MFRPDSQEGQEYFGIVIKVPDPWCSIIRGARETTGDPDAKLVTPHITLAPPLALWPSTLPQALEAATKICHTTSPFELVLSGSGTFLPVSAVAYVKLLKGASQCENLARRIRLGAFPHELRFPYHPHVTLAHGVSDIKLAELQAQFADFEANFVVDQITVKREFDDGVWRPVATLGLGENNA